MSFMDKIRKEKINKIVKNFIGKLPIFIFCCLFISIHNQLFGAENNIVGVVILTGLFMFMRGDLGYKAKQAAIGIIFMYLLVAVSPRLSMMNPFLGLAVNFLSIGMIMILSSHDLSQGNHIPFLMSYVFCQGYNVSGAAYEKRVLSLILGAVIIAAIYYLINRKKEYKRTVLDLFQEMDIHSLRTQWDIRMSVTLTLTMFVGDLLNYSRTMWISLAVLSLTTPFGEEHRERGKARIPAAILGTAIFYILFVLLIPEQYQTIVVLLAGFVAMFIQNYFIKSIYNSFSSLGAAVLLFPTQDALILRVLSNVLGTVLAVISYFVFDLTFGIKGIKKSETA